MLLLVAIILAASTLADPLPAPYEPRVIVITDIGTEPDDIQSMVRLLTYSNELDIEGLIASTSKHMRHRVNPGFIVNRIDAYAEVLANLRVHDERYPDAASLKRVVRAADPLYGMEGVGRGKHAEAAQLIIDAVDKPDPRPLWISIWGGAAPLAEALWRVRASRTPAEVEKFVGKLRVYTISDQDDASVWIRMTFPELFLVSSTHAMTEYALSTWVGMMVKQPWTDNETLSNAWLNENIRSHGPLGKTYPLPIFGVEGDTPSFLYLIPNGLGYAERPDWGSWGGRYAKLADFYGLWTDVQDSAKGTDGLTHTSNQASVWRWRRAYQNDFAARMDWTVSSSFGDANHPPVPHLNGTPGTAPLTIRVCPGEPVLLSAEGSSDPDGDPVAFSWMWYREVAGIYSPNLTMSEDSGPVTEVTVPVWTQPAEMVLPASYDMHVILVAEDEGTPQLTRYRRAVVSVLTGGGASDSGMECKPIERAEPGPVTDFTGDLALTETAGYSVYDSIGELLDNPDARAVLEQYLPELVEQASQSEQARGMTLHGVKNFMPTLTDEILQAINTELASVHR